MTEPRYEFLRELGKGGGGRVYLVRDRYRGFEVALKLIRTEEGDPSTLEREFSLLSSIDHPGIARVYDFGYLDDAPGLTSPDRKQPYFTSQYIAGDSLTARGRIDDPQEFLRLAQRLTDSVAFLHRNQILHLDIKAGNVLLTPGEPWARPVLIDFGLVRQVWEGPPTASVTGSLPYMGPEYFTGGELGPWTDVYALGVTLYRIATGRYPRFHDRIPAGERFLASAWDPSPPTPSQFWRSASRELDAVLLRCLALRPESRFRDGAALLTALEQVGALPAIQLRQQTPASLTVGREREFAIVDAFLGELFTHPEQPRVLFVTGAPGMGQTHLFRDIKIRAQKLGYRYYGETGYPGRATPPGSLLLSLGKHIPAEDTATLSRWRGFLKRLRKPHRTTRGSLLAGERRLRRAEDVMLAARAIRGPLVIGVDGLQEWDETSVELLVDLIQGIYAVAASERPPLAVVVGFREEGPLQPHLRDLAQFLLVENRACVVTLQGLDVEGTLQLYRRWRTETESHRLHASQPAAVRETALRVFQETGGVPARIAAIAAPMAAGNGEPVGEGTTPNARAELAASGDKGTRLLQILRLLERPARVAEIDKLVDLPRRRVESLLERLAICRLTEAIEREGRREGWTRGPAAEEVLPRLSQTERRKLHAAIGDVLIRLAESEEDPRRAEAVRHFELAGKSRQVVEHGAAVAAYLKDTFQNHLALRLFRAVLDSLPASQTRRRLLVGLEVAELHARVGDIDEGIQTLKGFLFRARRTQRGRWPEALHRKLQLRLASLYARQGDFRRADALFSEGLGARKGRAEKSGMSQEDVIFFLNEHAALKAFLGQYEAALEFCARGLKLTGNSSDPRIREVALNLYATRANVSLRNFDFAAAVDDFETALDLAEAVGSPVNQAMILNNLGISYAQSDRYRDGIRAFHEAERTSMQLDEGPSLASILANLGILYAKTGDWLGMEEAFRKADQLRTGAIGRRERFFLSHAKGLALVCRGRYPEARTQFEAAIDLGQSLGDQHVILFDRVYRAEALIFEAAYGEASAELEQLFESATLPSLRRMVLARRAFLAGITGQAAACCEHLDAYVDFDAGRPVPYLAAWDGVFLGWATFLAGDPERAVSFLDRAGDFFSQHGLTTGQLMVDYVRAEGRFLAGDAARALAHLEATEGAGNDFTAVALPLLKGRLMLAVEGTDGLARAADLSAEAGGYLVGNVLPEWRLRLDSLRATLGKRVAPDAVGAVEGERRRIAASLPEERRQPYNESPVWARWVEGLDELARATSAGVVAGDDDLTVEDVPEAPTSRTVALERAEWSPRRRYLVARSSRMAPLVETLGRLSGTELPVLITGETGTGKELVARILHEESPRADTVFQVVDCGSIPRELMSAELFGARAGAFTDQTDDRRGILRAAHGGTVFVDEIGNTSLGVQATLLRVLSERRVRPLGGEEEVDVDVRFVFSSARDLEKEMSAGRLREDLYHRINVVNITVPPLRERPEDIEGLVEVFLEESGDTAMRLGDGALRRLQAHAWPGNVRELRNLLQRVQLEGAGGLTLEALDRVLGDPMTTTLFPRNLLARDNLDELRTQLERDYVVFHMRRLDGDTEALCRFLGVRRRQLYNRLERLGISLREERRRMGKG